MDNESLLHSADGNLYAAKERGRNTVVFTTTL
jgi:GGDEF domain-containing protein